MTEVVQEAVQLAVGKTSLELRLNPGDLEALGDRVRVAVQESARGIEIKLLGDDKVSAGGCIVVTEHGEIDAQIDQELKDAIAFAEESPLPDPAEARSDIFTPLPAET